MTLLPCLVIEAIEVRDEQVSADLRIGPRHEKLEIGLSYADLVELKRLPRPLSLSQQAQHALFDALTRAYHGESMSLPLNLSSTVLDVSEPWPLSMKADDHTADPPVSVEVTRVDLDASDRDVTTVHMQVLGVPTVVIVDNRNMQREWTLFRFVTGAHPWQLTDVEAWAMLMAISTAIKTGITVP